ncbi:bone morphogenetic protein 1 homolog [Clavelina lepadiformis]|uniref:bone morphogenetic protein 1 homolog n=1 Tax=Clavelina lepadiformis TaxID=159417 RepID=UPI00404374AC
MSRRALLFLIVIIICCFQQCESQFSDDACSTGVVITEENGLSGTISTPNYPDDYDNNLNCTWIIQAPANKLVEVQIQDFLLESCDFKVYDFLDIYDGETLVSFHFVKNTN